LAARLGSVRVPDSAHQSELPELRNEAMKTNPYEAPQTPPDASQPKQASGVMDVVFAAVGIAAVVLATTLTAWGIAGVYELLHRLGRL
jgi:hypothetical protein